MTTPNLIETIIARLRQSPTNRPGLTLLMPDGRSEDLYPTDIVEGIIGYAQGARKSGIVPNDRVLIVPGHSTETILAFLGCIHLGAVPCLLPYRSARQSYVAELLAELTPETEAKWLAGIPETDPIFCDGADLGLQRAVLAPIASSDLDPCPESTAAPYPGEVAYLQLTSGTTSRSRAIEVTHRAALNNVSASMECFDTSSSDVYVGWLPLNHDMGLVSQILIPLSIGAQSVLISPGHWIRNPRVLLEMIHEKRGTVTYMPNFAFAYIAQRMMPKDVADLDLGSWRYIVNGAEMVRPESIEAFMGLVRAAGVKRDIVSPGYGLGENVLAVSIGSPGMPPRVLHVSAGELDKSGTVVIRDRKDDDAISVVSCGTPLRGTKVEIRDDEGKVLGNLKAGEVYISGDSLCPRYLTRPPQPISSIDGFATGDIGFMHDGELFICGRKKEVAIIAGRNINVSVVSAIVNARLGTLSRRMAVFPIASAEIGTETLVLVCELNRRLSDSETAELRSAIATSIADSLDIGFSDIVFKYNNWLPRTTSGKVNIKLARKKYLDQLGERTASHPYADAALATIEQDVVRIVSESGPVGPLALEQSIFDQGLDSLSAMEVLVRIEQAFDVRVSEEFFETPTLANLAALVRREKANTAHFGSKTVSFGKAMPGTKTRKAGRKSLLKRLVINGPNPQSARLSYGTGIAIQRTIARSPLTRTLFAKELGYVRKWHETLGGDDSIRSVATLNLMANSWKEWRDGSLVRETKRDSAWIRDIGCPDWLTGTDRTQGVVIVVPHALRLNKTLVAYLEQKTGREIAYLSGATAKLEAAGTGHVESSLKQSRARQLWAARSVLLSGGVFIIAGDGRAGDRTVSAPFFGRNIGFRVGPAELALKTGAKFLPVFPRLTPAGIVELRYRAELAESSTSDELSVADITERYAMTYRSEFPHFYPSLGWAKLKRLLAGKL